MTTPSHHEDGISSPSQYHALPWKSWDVEVFTERVLPGRDTVKRKHAEGREGLA